MAIDTSSISAAFSRFQRTADVSTVALAASTASRVTAALSIDAPDMCPYCKRQMRLTECVGLAVYLCDDDRHVTAAPNDVTLPD